MLFEKRYDWVDYPETDPGDVIEWNAEHVGFRVRVLSNASMSEVRHETSLFTASNGTDIDAQDEYWKYIAPRIPEWNLTVMNAKGKEVDLDPPAVNWEVLLDLPFELAMWLRVTVHWIHRPKIMRLLQEGVTTTDSIQPTPIHQAS